LSVLTRATRERNIPEEGILHSHRRETLKSYKFKKASKLLLKVGYLLKRSAEHYSVIYFEWVCSQMLFMKVFGETIKFMLGTI
jgi:hypothetical protein